MANDIEMAVGGSIVGAPGDPKESTRQLESAFLAQSIPAKEAKGQALQDLREQERALPKDAWLLCTPAAKLRSCETKAR